MSELRLGEMGADRPCVRCGFNLHGQPIVRESHYGLIVVRCPECAEVAALQEYPSLGRWAGRLAGAGALLWLVLVLGAAIGSGVLVFQLARQTAVDVLHPGAMRLAEAYRAYAKAKAEQLTDPVQRQQTTAWFDSYTIEQWPVLAQDYLETPAYHAVLAGISASDRSDFSRARSAGWILLWTIGMGAVWAVLAPHLRRKGLAVLCGVIVLVAAARWGVSLGSATPARVWGSYYWTTDLMFDRYGAPLMPMGLAVAVIGLYGGMLVGRPLARWLVKLLLPPRLRTPFGALWTLQGLPVPGPRRGSRVARPAES